MDIEIISDPLRSLDAYLKKAAVKGDRMSLPCSQKQLQAIKKKQKSGIFDGFSMFASWIAKVMSHIFGIVACRYGLCAHGMCSTKAHVKEKLEEFMCLPLQQ